MYRSIVIDFETLGIYGLNGPFKAKGSMDMGFKLFILCLMSSILTDVTLLTDPGAKLTLFVIFDFIYLDFDFLETVPDIMFFASDIVENCYFLSNQVSSLFCSKLLISFKRLALSFCLR